jgi:hypothetical protein
MRKSLILIMALCFMSTFILKAQFDAGKIMVGISSSSNNVVTMYAGGSANFFQIGFSTISSSGSSEKATTFNLSPRIGYFFVQNLALGLDINYSLLSYGTGSNKETNSIFGLGPFIRYYISPKKVAPFVEAAASFGSSSYKYDDTPASKTNLTSFLGGIGLAILLGDKFSFDIMGGYVSTTMKENSSKSTLGTIGFKIGFHTYLGGHKNPKK